MVLVVWCGGDVVVMWCSSGGVVGNYSGDNYNGDDGVNNGGMMII